MLTALRRHLEWRAVLIAGLVAGTVYTLWLALLFPVVGFNIGLFLRYVASLVLGSGAVTSTDVLTLIVGLLVHFGLSLFYTLLIAIVVHRWGLMVGIIGGGLMGLCFYGINYLTLTLLVPWMYVLTSPVLLIGHVIFGAVAGGVYEALDHYDRPLVPEEDVP